jgi:hypothetical protein
MPSAARVAEKRCKLIEQANPLGGSAPLARHEERLWRKIFKKDSWIKNGRRCTYCRSILKYHETTADHVKAQSQGGQTSSKNITVCCEFCNNAKGSMSIKAFKIKLRGPAPELGPPSYYNRDRLCSGRDIAMLISWASFLINSRVEKAEKKIRKAVGL